MTLAPDDVQDLVVMAFCLEPLADKPGCTTRFVDLPGKPLTDFIVAGINVGKYFRMLAEDVARNAEADIFGYYLPALQSANRLKSPKTINFGLLEIMFPAVHARLQCSNRAEVIDALLEGMRRERPRDVDQMIMARREAWKTSITPAKQGFTGAEFTAANSPYDFYMRLREELPSTDSGHQWAEQYVQGLPVLRDTLDELTQQEPLAALAVAYTKATTHNPELKPGIVADMGAAALFLHLSFAVDPRI